MPRRRRRGAAAIAVEAEAERGLLMRILLHSPKDMVAGALAFTAVSAIIANALFLQSGPHPAPMFGSVVTLPVATPASPLPRPRPVEALVKPVETMPAEPRFAEPKAAEPKLAEPKASDPMANLVRATAAPVTSPSALRPPASIPVSSHNEAGAGQTAAARRVAAVQRTLTEYGYGQLKPTGTMSADTLAAIQKFERERKIPVTGQITDRLVHELAAVTGRPVE
jgi:hypothetical protein